MIQVYIDAEFDAVRYQKRFEQAVISFGAVACRQKQILHISTAKIFSPFDTCCKKDDAFKR